MKDLSCSGFEGWLADYAENRVPSHERAAMDAHRDGCPKCGLLLAEYCAIPAIVRDATRAEMSSDARATLRRLLAHTWRRRD